MQYKDLRGKMNLYRGQWVEGRKDGFGKVILPSNDIYIGEWNDDRREGYGELLSQSGNQEIYNGEWSGDMKQGNGVLITKQNIYTGEWKQDKVQGDGQFLPLSEMKNMKVFDTSRIEAIEHKIEVFKRNMGLN